MVPFIGTKSLLARSMTRAEYLTYRGWELPADENPEDLGYLVEYTDGGKGNHPDHEGYISWSPRDVFEKAYRATALNMTFGHAVELLKAGHKVARAGWNGKGMWLMLMSGGETTLPTDETFSALPFIVMKTVQDTVVPWLASQTDVLAEDWTVIA
ncbi:DUF2829 domain-containing protein [Novosphingobium sp.]|uniref:DUF2829 domain-containing protein n=1 Tax=Novosphingobium sp. TaxID=1874826 RepID=UPI0031DED671